MKKLFLIATLLAVGGMVLFTGFKSSTGLEFTNSGNPKITTPDKLFGNKARPHFFDQTVDYNLATACVLMYQHVYFKAANVDSIINAYSTSADFGSKTLSSWTLDIANNTNAVTTKMCFGIYTKDMGVAYPGVKVGRLTIFLFPVDAKGNRAVYINNSTFVPVTPNGQKALSAAKTGDPTNPFDFSGLQP
jgi:hypothetical protein